MLSFRSARLTWRSAWRVYWSVSGARAPFTTGLPAVVASGCGC